MGRVLWRNLRRSLSVLVIFFLLAGLAYPVAETVLAQSLFARAANGSLGANGSALVGQHWRAPRWFQGRPDPERPGATGAANLGPRSRTLVRVARRNAQRLRAMGITPTPDLVTTSASGVDPDISPGDALAQVNAVARARHLPVAVVRRLVVRETHGPEWGFLGAPYVNVLALNTALAHLR